jgi:hypothetical protein
MTVAAGCQQKKCKKYSGRKKDRRCRQDGRREFNHEIGFPSPPQVSRPKRLFAGAKRGHETHEWGGGKAESRTLKSEGGRRNGIFYRSKKRKRRELGLQDNGRRENKGKTLKS